MICETRECDKLDELLLAVDDLKGALCQAQRRGDALHVVERDVVRAFVMRAGRMALEAYVELHGTGDLGPVIASAQGQELDRLEETRSRPYVSVFGPLEIERTLYSRGSRQRETAPLDALLGLPEGKFSFLVQEFGQLLGVDLAWDKTREVLERVLGICVPVDSLERLNRHMAEDVPEYRDQRTTVPVKKEGAIFVSSADGKGIVMRQPVSETSPRGSSIVPPQTTGPRPGRKAMSVVGSLYSVDRYVRTPEQMLEILFRDGPRLRLAQVGETGHVPLMNPNVPNRAASMSGRRLAAAPAAASSRWESEMGMARCLTPTAHVIPCRACIPRFNGCRTSGRSATPSITSPWFGSWMENIVCGKRRTSIYR